MKLSAILEDDENVVMIPLCWLTRDERQKLIRDGYEVIPISGYQETRGCRAFKIIGNNTYNINWWIFNFSIPIWEDWKLTAIYASRAERPDSTAGRQMFDRLDDDEKIKTLKEYWYPITRNYIIEYFEDHSELLDRARHSLKPEEIYKKFKDLFIR